MSVMKLGAVFGLAAALARPAAAFTEIGNYATPTDRPSIAVNGDWVYLSQNRQIYIVDASNLNAIRLVNIFTVTGDIGIYGIVDIAYANGRIHAWCSHNRLFIVDVSDPYAPRQRSNVLHGSPIITGGQQVHVEGNRAYATTRIGNHGVSIIDVSNPASQRLIGKIVTMAFVALPVGNRLYVGHGNGDGLLVYDISNASAPRHIGASLFGLSNLSVNSIARLGQRLVLATGHGLLVVDPSDSYNMRLLHHVAGGKSRVVAISDTAVVSGTSGYARGIEWYDMAHNGTLSRRYAQTCQSDRLAFSNGRLYTISRLLGQPTTMRVYATSSATSTWDAGHQNLNGGWRRLNWFGDYTPMSGTGWIWHNRHGFFYVASNAQPGSIWLYAQDMGWLWTSPTHYPFLYRSNSDAWLWYNGTTNPRWFKNMRTGLWESRP